MLGERYLLGASAYVLIGIFSLFKSFISEIKSYGKKFANADEGRKFIEEYKCKWETGSNETTQEMRDKKIGEILDEE